MNRFSVLCLSLAILIGGCKKSTDAPITSVAINGKTYPVVKIGTQLWTAQNYDGLLGGVPNPYADENTVGKFYSATEVNSITLPPGWRVPTVDDYVKLFKSEGSVTQDGWGDYTLDDRGSSNLRSQSNWAYPGSNYSGFNAIGAGYYQAGQVYNYNASATFWTSSIPTYSSTSAKRSIMGMNGFTVTEPGGKAPVTTTTIVVHDPQNDASFSLRFVKDN